MIAYLSMIVALRVIWDEKSMGNLVLSTEASYLLAGEVRPIVRDNGVREPKATYDILPKESDYLLSCDIGEWHRFYSLGEVVCSYQ